jgi:hypothetical protein
METLRHAQYAGDRAYDLGGTVYEGKASYSSMEVALQDLDVHIKAYMDENGI